MTIFQQYFNQDKKRIAVLLDPDKLNNEQAKYYGEKIENSPADMILAGGSMVSNSVSEIIKAIKEVTNKPIILFPGSSSQFCEEADALLMLSLISGRNPEYLIGEHVKSAFRIKKSGIETIATGYLLIDGGKTTAVQYISNTMPLPADKPDLVAATAIAGELLGLKNIYLEAGSGALNPVKKEVIKEVRKYTSLPIMVGGGMRNLDAINQAFEAGADIAVIGTAFEKNPLFFSDSVLI